jgi:putative transcriptional regulator
MFPRRQFVYGRHLIRGFLSATVAPGGVGKSALSPLAIEVSPTGLLMTIPMTPVLEAVGQEGGDVTGDMRVFSGGPVQPEVGFVVHSTDYHWPETVAVNDRLSMTSRLDILRDIVAKKRPAKILVAFGYAGWGPGQLEGEIEVRAWGSAEADPALIFDEDRDKVWDYACEHRTQHF